MGKPVSIGRFIKAIRILPADEPRAGSYFPNSYRSRLGCQTRERLPDLLLPRIDLQRAAEGPRRAFGISQTEARDPGAVVSERFDGGEAGGFFEVGEGCGALLALETGLAAGEPELRLVRPDRDGPVEQSGPGSCPLQNPLGSVVQARFQGSDEEIVGAVRVRRREEIAQVPERRWQAASARESSREGLLARSRLCVSFNGFDVLKETA